MVHISFERREALASLTRKPLANPRKRVRWQKVPGSFFAAIRENGFLLRSVRETSSVTVQELNNIMAMLMFGDLLRLTIGLQIIMSPSRYNGFKRRVQGRSNWLVSEADRFGLDSPRCWKGLRFEKKNHNSPFRPMTFLLKLSGKLGDYSLAVSRNRSRPCAHSLKGRLNAPSRIFNPLPSGEILRPSCTCESR